MEQKPHEIFPKDTRKTYGLMEMVRGTTPMADTGVEDTVMSWPHLVVMEAIAILGVSLVMLVISMVANAPLREIANPDVTENPAKAPWYFMNLQELLLHMTPSLAGVISPSILILFLMAIPYLDRHLGDVGVWFAGRRGKAIALRTTAYTTLALVGLILFDEYIRVRSLIGRPEIVPGWIIPIVTILGLSLGLYGLVRPLRPSTRELVIAYFTGFIVTYFVLTIVGLFLRGLGMHLALPWELPPGALSF